MNRGFEIGLASPEHGAAIRRLIGADQWEGLEVLDWTTVAGGWVVLARGAEIVACMQLLPGRPLGRAEHMGLAASLTDMQRACAVSMLIDRACMLLRSVGCGAIMVHVPHELEGYQHSLERRGAVHVADGKMMIKRLV